jgi:lambda family phage portal protein
MSRDFPAGVRIGRVVPKAIAAPMKPRANADWSEPYGAGTLTTAFAYESDSLYSPELNTWVPWLRSPDTEINWYRDRRVSRTRDIERNDGWARGATMRVADDTIGSQFRLIADPDWEALARVAPGFDAAWADKFAEVVESEWALWADDPVHWCDATRSLSMVQMFRVQLRHKIVDGEDLAVLLWKPEVVGPGAARYATTLAIIDPDRLSNPYQGPDTHNLRGGREINNDGAPIAYHIRRAHQNDMFDAAESMVWDRIPRETEWGRPVVIHDFDHDRAAQNRGVGLLNPVLAKLKMLGRYDTAELQQALLQTVISTFVESPYDPEQIRNAMEAPAGGYPELDAYQQMRSDFHSTRGLMAGDVRIPTLAPGEKVSFAAPRHPSQNFGEFEHAALRSVASAMGTTAEAITRDFSKANYSSLRASMLDAWRTMVRRRADFGIGTATPVYTAFLEELLDREPALLPRRAPDFMEMRAAYAGCRWIGPGRGWVDPVKERQGAVLGLDAGFGTLQDECAEISGADWRKRLRQRAREIKQMKELGLPAPDWAKSEPAHEVATRPEAE